MERVINWIESNKGKQIDIGEIKPADKLSTNFNRLVQIRYQANVVQTDAQETVDKILNSKDNNQIEQDLSDLKQFEKRINEHMNDYH